MAAGERELTPLEAAMASSFEYSPHLAERKLEPSLSAAAQPTPQAAQAGEPAPAELDPSLSSSSSEPAWKEEYDERLAEWRAAAAVAREKAEQERAKWEAIRAEEAKNKPSATSSFASGWESVGATTMASSTASLAASSHVAAESTPSPADARDMTTNEHPGGRGAEVLEDVLGPRPPAEQQHPIVPEHAREETTHTGTDEDSGKSRTWENIPSLASSFPSLPSRPTPPSMLEPSPPRRHPPPPAPARSITLVLFDPETSTRTRLLALAATLGINFFLPFINGVMLGFGEITAKAIVNWWRPGPKLSTTQLGIRAAPVV